MKSEKEKIVDLIREVLGKPPPIFIDGNADQSKARLANQLIKSGYLDGSPIIGERGQVRRVAILDVTIEGRQYSDQLEDEIRNSRLGVKAGKTAKKIMLILMGAVGGILLTVATQWILSLLKLK
jgi:hypothetical protein